MSLFGWFNFGSHHTHDHGALAPVVDIIEADFKFLADCTESFVNCTVDLLKGSNPITEIHQFVEGAVSGVHELVETKIEAVDELIHHDGGNGGCDNGCNSGCDTGCDDGGWGGWGGWSW